MENLVIQCRNCMRRMPPHGRGLCNACHIWEARHGGEPRPIPRYGRTAMRGPCKLCGSALPHTPDEFRRHRKIYHALWAYRRALATRLE